MPVISLSWFNSIWQLYIWERKREKKGKSESKAGYTLDRKAWDFQFLL
jgi:hypothetical protein